MTTTLQEHRSPTEPTRGAAPAAPGPGPTAAATASLRPGWFARVFVHVGVKLSVLLAVLLCASFCILVYTTNRSHEAASENNIVQLGTQHARSIEKGLVDSMQTGSFADLKKHVESMGQTEGIESLRIYQMP